MSALTMPVPTTAPETRQPGRRARLDGSGPEPVGPTDMPQGHASGPAPYRLLLIGGAGLVSEGVISHELSLTGTAARSLASLTGHGVDIDLLTGGTVTIADAEKLLQGRDLRHLDGLVLILEPGRTPATHQLRDRLRRLLVDAATGLPASSPITVVVSAGEPALPQDTFRSFSSLVCAATVPLAHVIELPHLPADTDPYQRYRQWGARIAEHLSRRVADPHRWRASFEAIDEAARQAAVNRLPRLNRGWRDELAQIVDLARTAYGTRFAALTLVDGESARHLVRHGFDLPRSDRRDTIDHAVLHAHGGILLSNGREDRRFQTMSAARGGALAFYTGYRIENSDQQPVAALSVFDPEPRPISPHDITIIRDLAHTIQRSIWQRSQNHHA